MFRPPAAADLLRPGLAEVLALLRVAFGGGARPEQGLLIARRFYDAVGGHTDGADAEAALLRTIGRRRIAMLSAGRHHAWPELRLDLAAPSGARIASQSRFDIRRRQRRDAYKERLQWQTP